MSRWTIRWLAPVALVAWTGCAAPQVRATDGRVQTDLLAAGRASAARDLPCDSNAIAVKDVSTPDITELVATGCGFGVHYRKAWTPGLFDSLELVEIGRFPLSPASTR